MKEASVYALAKLNLGLDIKGRLPNGYHLVDMVMQTIKLGDTVEVRANGKKEINISCTKDFVPVDERNLAYKAAALLQKRYPERDLGVDIHIKKVIPMAAGMAGGSTDGAAVLYAMNDIFSLNLKRLFLMQISLELGADVPFCLFRGTARATGIGERLERLSPIPKCLFLIAKPSFSVSTKETYEAYDSLSEPLHPDMDALCDAIGKGDIAKMTAVMGNTLEQVTADAHPEIRMLEDIMYEEGALKSMMTGSGPTVFGMYDDDRSAKAAYDRIANSGITKSLFICNAYQV